MTGSLLLFFSCANGRLQTTRPPSNLYGAGSILSYPPLAPALFVQAAPRMCADAVTPRKENPAPRVTRRWLHEWLADAAPRRPTVVSSFFTLRVAAALLVTVGGFSTLFALLEGWGAIDAVYFTTTTLATIGFGDLRPIRPISRVLTSLLGICGVGLLGGLVSAVLNEYWRQDEEAARLEGEEAGEYWRRDEDNDVMRPAAPASRSRLHWTVLPSWSLAGLLVGIGTLGFRVCERGRSSWAEAAYLVFGATTTAGLGDIVPTTKAAKLFLSLYAPFAVVTFARVVGGIALRPLELARIAAQQAVLEAYGDVLTAQTLDEVARGPLVKRLGLSSDDSTCSRDEFTLLTLTLQGKLTEADLESCRAIFDKLDVTGEGKLSMNDLKALRRRKLAALEPRLRQRRLRRLRQPKGLAAGATQRRAEESFPYRAEASGDNPLREDER